MTTKKAIDGLFRRAAAAQADMQRHQERALVAAHQRAEMIAQLRGAGIPVVEIAGRLGITRQAVYAASSDLLVGTKAGG